MNGNDIGWAVFQMKCGLSVRRAGWNGKGMYLVYVPGSQEPITITPNTPYHKAGLTKVKIDSHIDMYTAGGTMQPGWLASQADLLATDWEIAK
jgi:hypothetical protein